MRKSCWLRTLTQKHSLVMSIRIAKAQELRRGRIRQTSPIIAPAVQAFEKVATRISRAVEVMG